MKTKALLDKYTRTIKGLLECKTVEFQVLNERKTWNTIGALEYPDKPELMYNWSLGTYRLLVNDGVAASWKLYQLPHCCAIAVSCESLVNSNYRGKRLGTTLNSLRQDIARVMGYSLLLCTDITTNTHQRQLLATQGWKDIYQVHNKRTKNDVIISVINI